MRSSLRHPLFSPEDLGRFITHEADCLYHDSMYNCTFVLECGFSTSNAYFTYLIQRKGWEKICEHPPKGIAPIICEFHSNLPHKDGSTIYDRGKYVKFDAATINRAYGLKDNDNEAYMALF